MRAQVLFRPSVPVFLLILGSVSASAVAQSATCDWGRVRQLHPNQTIVVQTADTTPLVGRLVSTSDNGLRIDVRGAAQDLTRDAVVEISAPKTSAWKTGLGLLLAGGGLVLANAAMRNPEAGPGPAWFAGLPMAIVGGITMHAERRRWGLIYKRP